MPATSSRLDRIARPWHLLTALVSALSLIVQVVLVIRGVNVLADESGQIAPVGIRILRFFSYFTVQSNILVIITCLALAAAPQRDGKVWRVLRIDALVGITVTLIVYHFALRPILDLHGISAVTDIGFHYVTPLLAIIGWMLFGPRHRIDRDTVAWSLLWPALYFAYSLIHGAISDWYPYPFVDVGVIGYLVALRNVVLVCILLAAIGALYVYGDRKLPVTSVSRRRGR
ncbi:hypothetical protein CLV47_104230 [Antricoccus suffuscus]|uniref:FAR-17a/AIG1-like protein n=1 Tax=Antricoccus suffuscus TaxID=1629062 RepID=A0A2T1A2P8_9ACTN|nr:Pr6Pr family membrane protein [Antricoccus suffuscus]PRZ42882.1 hypothetical protein CLV47_104230 [Antricoccus suffuscus]